MRRSIRWGFSGGEDGDVRAVGGTALGWLARVVSMVEGREEV